MRAAVVAVLVLSAFRTASAAPCPPVAELAGDRGAVERVAAELRALGVVVRAAPATVPRDVVPPADGDGCRVIDAVVQRADDGAIAVAVRGGGRAREGRVLSDAALAAAWIDSWTRTDVDAALWTPPPPSAVGAAAPPTRTPAIVAPRDVAPVPGPAPGSLARFAVAASYEQAWSDDDARWRGVGLAGCVHVDGFCVGARVRALVDPERVVGVTAMERSDLSALATLSYPRVLGTMALAPELGMGIGRLATTRVDGTCTPMPPVCDPTDPMCAMSPPTCEAQPGSTVEVGDGLAARTYAVRFALALRVAVPLFRHVWLDGIGGVGWSPFAHTTPFGGGAPGPMTMPSPDPLALPGEPRTSYQLGLGVRVGAP